MRYFPIILVASFLLACSGSPVTDKYSSAVEGGDFTGRYSLVSIDGAAVPATIYHGGAVTMHSGVFMINANGTCSSITVFSPPGGGKVTRKVDATYTREGSKLYMQWEGAGRTTGTVAGGTFTMDNEGMIFDYRK